MTFSEHLIEWDDSKVARLWDFYSRTPPYSEQYFSKIAGDRMLAASGLQFHRSLEVLDFGSGPGFLWEHLRRADARWRYTGLDFSAQSIEALRAKAAGHPLFNGAILVRELPSVLPDARFDAVLLFEVVEHLTDAHLDATLAEAHRLLRPSGVLAVTTPNAEKLGDVTRFCPDCGAIYHQWQHVRSWTAATLAPRVCASGFRLSRSRTLDFKSRGLRGFAARQVRRWLLGEAAEPHLIAVFTKT